MPLKTTMEKQNITRKGKTTVISVRTPIENSKWLAENNISPTLLFNEAIKELREREE